MRLPDLTGSNVTGTLYKSGSIQQPVTGDKISLYISPTAGSQILNVLAAVRGTGSVAVNIYSVESLGDTSGILHASASDIEQGPAVSIAPSMEIVEAHMIVQAYLTVLGDVEEFILQLECCVCG